MQLFATPGTAALQASPSFTVSQSLWSLLKFMSIESVIPPRHFILPSIFPSFSLFQQVSSLLRVAQVLELQLQHQSFQWIFRGLIFFQIDWFDLLAVQTTLRSLLQHQFKSVNSSAFSLRYGPHLTYICDYWKTMALTTLIFVGKVISLLFNVLSRFIIAFLSRSKHLLILWLQSLSEPPRKSFIV